jgi:hypothetical protein
LLSTGYILTAKDSSWFEDSSEGMVF